MADLRELLPLFQDLKSNQEPISNSFYELSLIVMQDGYRLYWDNDAQRYCIYPSKEVLDLQEAANV